MLITVKGLDSHDSDRLLIPFKKAGWDWDTDDYFGQIKLIKDCQSYAQAIHEFEKISGYSVLDTDHDGADIFWFLCEEKREVFSGWKALKYIYKNWYETPRECLEALNRKTHDVKELYKE